MSDTPMNVNERPLRKYVGFIWIDDEPGVRLAIEARSVEDARAVIIAQYGEGHRISVWNEEDASRPRNIAEQEAT